MCGMINREHEWELCVLPRRHFKCSKAGCNEILSFLKAEAMLNEHAALKRENEAGRLFGVWLQAIWEDTAFRKDGGGRTYAELLDYILVVFPDALKEGGE